MSQGLRDVVMEAYPALGGEGLKATAYRQIMQYVLFGSFVDDDTGDRVLPYRTVADLVSDSARSHRFNAAKWIDLFSREVAPLNPSPYIYAAGKARTIRPEIAPAVTEAISSESAKAADNEGRVWFHSGLPVSRRSEQEAMRDYEADMRDIADQTVGEKHPARPLIDYLREQPQVRVGKLLAENLPHVQAAVWRLPSGTKRDRDRRGWCESLLISLKKCACLYYKGSENTPRIFAVGASVHQLPRDIRKIAFSGCSECDLRSAQLAVVAKIWDIPILDEFLRAEKSIWAELHGYAQLPNLAYKPILKRTVYSIVFGMKRENLHTQLASGNMNDSGVGNERAEVILKHPLIRKLLTARNKALDRIWYAGGGVDAWGNWIPTMWTAGDKKVIRETRSVLSHVVQSYELRLMLPALDVIRKEQQVYLVSWLHDGITVLLGNSTKADAQERRLQKAVQGEAAALGIATYLEVDRIPAAGEAAAGSAQR